MGDRGGKKDKQKHKQQAKRQAEKRQKPDTPKVTSGTVRTATSG